jgi:hypothetical protein
MKCNVCKEVPSTENIGYRIDADNIICARCLEIRVETINYYKQMAIDHQKFLADDWEPNTTDAPSHENLKANIEGY